MKVYVVLYENYDITNICKIFKNYNDAEKWIHDHYVNAEKALGYKFDNMYHRIEDHEVAE